MMDLSLMMLILFGLMMSVHAWDDDSTAGFALFHSTMGAVGMGLVDLLSLDPMAFGVVYLATALFGVVKRRSLVSS